MGRSDGKLWHGKGQYRAGVNWHWIIRADCAHLFPTLRSLTSWELEIHHSGSIYHLAPFSSGGCSSSLISMSRNRGKKGNGTLLSPFASSNHCYSDFQLSSLFFFWHSQYVAQTSFAWPLSRFTADLPKWELRYLPPMPFIHSKARRPTGMIHEVRQSHNLVTLSTSGTCHLCSTSDMHNNSHILDDKANFGIAASLKCDYDDTSSAGLR